MPITKTIQLYKFDELSDSAKERARAWYRDGMESWEYAESVIEDAAECARIMGIVFDERDYKTVGGHTRSEPCVWWSGFSSQGDGASFDAHYRYARDSVRQIKACAPQDVTLHDIAQALADVQRRNFYRLTARAKHSGPYMHSGWMDVHCERTDEREVSAEDERAVHDALRRFADWIYRQLETEYEYRAADEQIDETIRANDYTFTEDGARADA